MKKHFLGALLVGLSLAGCVGPNGGVGPITIPPNCDVDIQAAVPGAANFHVVCHATTAAAGPERTIQVPSGRPTFNFGF